MASPGGSSEDEAEIRDEQRQGEIIVQVFKGELPPLTPLMLVCCFAHGERERAADW